MAELNEQQTVYYIPDNYIEEGRIFQGRIRIRDLIEGLVLAIPFALLGWALGKTLETKLFLSILLGGPLLVLGVIGINGDPLSVVLRSIRNFSKKKRLRLYNSNPRPYQVTPVQAIFSEESGRDRLATAYENYQQKRLNEKLNLEMVEGEDYVFAPDDHETRYANGNFTPATAEQKQVVVLESEDDSYYDDLFDNIRWDN